MGRSLTLSLVLVAAGFVAGLAVTGRVRTTAEVSPAEAPLSAPAPEPAPAATSGTEQRPVAPPIVGVVGPDFTRVAGQAVRGVANISSMQVVRQRNSPFTNDPFFRYFFGDEDLYARDRRS